MTTATRKPKARKNGDGSVYQTADGRWRGAVTWADPISHARMRKVVSGTSREDVRVKVTALTANLDKGVKPTSTMMVADYLGAWLRAKAGLKPATVRMYTQMVESYLVPHLGTVRLDTLSVADVQRMTRGMMAGRLATRPLSARTAAHARTVLRTALNDALEARLIGWNAAATKATAVTQVKRTTLKFLDSAQVQVFIDTYRNTFPLPVIGLLTGMRQGELLGLTWDAVKDGRTIVVSQQMARAAGGGYALASTKTGNVRTITMSTVVRAALVTQKRLQDAQAARLGSRWGNDAGLVFTDDAGRPMRGDSVNHQWHRLLEEAGLPSIPFHGARHSAATAALAAGVPIRYVADMMGHSTLALMDLYVHVGAESRDGVAAAMDKVFS